MIRLTEAGLGLTDTDADVTSSLRFTDGGQYRVEIASVEGPEALAVVLDEAEKLGVPIHRVSQGSGGMLLTDDEIREMADMGANAGVEVCLFARPTASWGTGSMSRVAAGPAVASQIRGNVELTYALDEIVRTAELGIRSALISDLGLLRVADALRRLGHLPSAMAFKTSVMMGFSNAASIAVAEQLGAASFNVPTDLTTAHLGAIRRTVALPLDVYVESPDDVGGVVRHTEIDELVRVASPIYLKFGLRNAPDLYPSGLHLSGAVRATARERVRRAALGLAVLERRGGTRTVSPVPGTDAAVPQPTPDDESIAATLSNGVSS